MLGPVLVKANKHGRGLYLTEDVKKVQLLLVSNPIAFSYGEEDNDILVELLHAARGSSKALAQLSALAYCHDKGREVPDMDIFKLNVSWKPSEAEPQLNVWRMIDMMCLNNFAQTAPAGRRNVKITTWKGVWGLPALINHSCLPTVTRTLIGRATFVRAARDLSAGDELLWSYTYSAAPWLGFRQHKCSESWQFRCSCERCTVEQKYEHVLKKVGFKFPRFDPAEAREVVCRLENALGGLTEAEKRLLRAGYVHAYAWRSSGV